MVTTLRGYMENPLENLKRYNVKLASASPRRRELLGMLGIEFEVMRGIEVEESYPSTIALDYVPEYLARKKAAAYALQASPDDLIITADTVVILGGEVLGKPKSDEDARLMLKLMSNRVHQVVTGVAVVADGEIHSLSTSTFVEFAPLTEEEIIWYVDQYRPLDKAGSYGIQEWIGAVGVSRIDGSFYNVMGLPVHRLYTLLKSL